MQSVDVAFTSDILAREYRRSVRVELFVTCVVDMFSPEVGAGVVKVLRTMDVDVGVPPGQTCCGQPAWNSGFHRDGARVAGASLAALAAALDADPSAVVVVPAGSCATMIRVFWPEMFELTHDHARAELARVVGRRTFEFSEFVERYADRLPPGLGAPATEAATRPGTQSATAPAAAYHHSCHMLRELRIAEAPGRLLALAGQAVAPWPADQRCCGFGGLFSLKLPEASEAMADDKLAALPEGCGEVIGCDTSCLLHLQARAGHEGRSVRIRHLAEVLADALDTREAR